MAASKPGNTDRGWNDPPMFDYQGSVTASHFGTGSPQHHNKLNKRVAYPMSSSDASCLPTGTATLLNPSEGPPRLPPIQILPPVSTTSTPTPLPLLVPTLSPTADSTQQPAIFSPPVAVAAGSVEGASVKVKDLSTVLADLSFESEELLLPFVREGLASALESVKDVIQGRAVEEVKKKLLLMEECWSAGKITPPVKSQLGSLVAAVNKEEIEEAHEIHLALMINHTAEVHQWLVGIKRVIQALHTKRSQLSQDEEGSNVPATDPCVNLLTENISVFSPSQTTDASSQDLSSELKNSGEQDIDTETPVADSS